MAWEVGGGGGSKNGTPFFWVENHESFGVSGSRLHGVCMGSRGTSTNAVYALLSRFWYVGGFDDLGDPVLSTVSGVSGDVMTVYAC